MQAGDDEHRREAALIIECYCSYLCKSARVWESERERETTWKERVYRQWGEKKEFETQQSVTRDTIKSSISASKNNSQPSSCFNLVFCVSNTRKLMNYKWCCLSVTMKAMTAYSWRKAWIWHSVYIDNKSSHIGKKCGSHTALLVTQVMQYWWCCKGQGQSW